VSAGALSFEQLKRHALSLGAAKAFDYGLQFLLPIVLVRCLDTATFGEYRLLWLVVGTVMAVATLNVPQSLYYFLPRADARMKRVYLAQTLAFTAAVGAACAWAVSPWNPWLPGVVAPLAKYDALVPVFLALTLVTYLLDFLPTVEERVRWQTISVMAFAFLRAVLLSAGAFFTADLRVLIWLLIAYCLLRLAVLAWYIVRHHGLARPWFDAPSFAGHVRHAAPIGGANALFGLRGQADQWVAAYLFALGSFAAFSIAAGSSSTCCGSRWAAPSCRA
jgi:O-antigen/teichoic acid export membrane protein